MNIKDLRRLLEENNVPNNVANELKEYLSTLKPDDSSGKKQSGEMTPPL
ncbi:MAG: hypothetical protein FWE48_06350 [Coriobacteriia bacterium]|nr:hypothetical protein [Coriobacteriia bacterium]